MLVSSTIYVRKEGGQGVYGLVTCRGRSGANFDFRLIGSDFDSFRGSNCDLTFVT